MSNGDDGEPEGADAEEDDEMEPAGDPGPVESFGARLDEVEAALEDAETEADLDEVEEMLDGIEADLEDADLPEPAEDEEEDEEEDPRADLEDRLGDLRDRLTDERGPYAEDVADAVSGAAETVRETRWTDDGWPAVVSAVETYLETATADLDEEFAVDGERTDALADALDAVADALADSDLHPDEDAEVIGELLGAAETLADDVDAAEEWDDLTIQEQLDHEGFYDVLTAENRKDFPPELSAVKIYAELNEPEPILLALDRLDSEFMADNIYDTLKSLAPPEAFEAIHQRAQKRNEKPVEILGKIGDERALETLHDFVDGDGDPALQKVTLRAIGEIGSEESTQAVADRLAADSYEIRSAAARALGLIGDTRAIDPLGDVLDDDEADEVRASAAWALNQIGTERALETVAEYDDDRSYIVQAEAQKAV